MNDGAVKRRLAAILSADVVGYSKLMGADEEGTLRALRQARREVVDPTIAGNAGRIFKTTGDGLLAEFASAVDAVRAAIGVQSTLARQAGGAALTFRIGVNLGDVIVETNDSGSDDIFGDGVNVAARLQEMAEPGAVFMSSIVHDQVAGKLGHGFADLGERAAKNIARPIRVFAWRGDGFAAPSAPRAATPADKPSIVVLPFENMSGDAEHAFFSDGISEDLITDLSKVSGLMVIARNSAFAYKGRNVDIRQVTRDLGVRYALEGSVRRGGNRVRITAQLIDGASGGHLWAERFDRDLNDIFAVQDEVTRQIVDALKVKLTKEEGARVSHRGTDNLEAYESYLRGRAILWRVTKQTLPEGRRLFEQAIGLDPNFAAAIAGLAMTHSLAALNQWSESGDRSLKTARELAERALAADPAEPEVHFVQGVVQLWSGHHDEAIAAQQRALALDSNFAKAFGAMGAVMIYAGRPEESLGYLEKAMRLDPHFMDTQLHFKAQALAALGRWQEAIEVLRERIARNPDTDISRVLLAACYGQLGRDAEARAAWAEALKVNPAYSLEHRRRTLPYKDPAEFDRIYGGLAKAGIAV